ncbi:MAG: DegV family protein [Candidatus Nanopelagicales bacterium]
MPKVAVVTDGSAGLPPHMLHKYDIKVVPIDVVIDGVICEDISPREIVESLEDGLHVTTSRPAPDRFLQVFEDLHSRGYDGVAVGTLSAGLSGTFESAQMAAKVCTLPVEVVDSQSIGLGLGFPVFDAARVAAQGAPIEVVARELSTRARQASVYFYLDTLEYLRKGGRIGAASALIGTALAVKPILQLTDGLIAPCEKVRTESRAIERIVELALVRVKNDSCARFGIQHLGAPDRAQKCADFLKVVYPEAEIVISEVDAVVGVHAGPGLVAIIVSDNPQPISGV